MSSNDHGPTRFGVPRYEADTLELVSLSERELDFLRLACSEMTYFAISREMYVSERTVDGYRDSLFRKLNVTSRVGLVIFAVRHGIVRL